MCGCLLEEQKRSKWSQALSQDRLSGPCVVGSAKLSRCTGNDGPLGGSGGEQHHIGEALREFTPTPGRVKAGEWLCLCGHGGGSPSLSHAPHPQLSLQHTFCTLPLSKPQRTMLWGVSGKEGTLWVAGRSTSLEWGKGLASWGQGRNILVAGSPWWELLPSPQGFTLSLGSQGGSG